MKTTFAGWLDEHGETPYTFSARTGVRYWAVRLYAGISGSVSNRLVRIDMRPLEAIAADTGIAIGTLVEEALEAAKHPTPPRSYRRKAQGEGNLAVKE